MAKVPSSAWARQRLDDKAARLRELTDTLTPRLLERTEAPITPYQGFVRLELDTFVLENPVSAQAHSRAAAVKAVPAAGRSHNSGTKKEAVGRTCQGVDGY